MISIGSTPLNVPWSFRQIARLILGSLSNFSFRYNEIESDQLANQRLVKWIQLNQFCDKLIFHEEMAYMSLWLHLPLFFRRFLFFWQTEKSVKKKKKLWIRFREKGQWSEMNYRWKKVEFYWWRDCFDWAIRGIVRDVMKLAVIKMKVWFEIR
jgi:hypothetical protein